MSLLGRLLRKVKPLPPHNPPSPHMLRDVLFTSTGYVEEVVSYEGGNQTIAFRLFKSLGGGHRYNLYSVPNANLTPGDRICIDISRVNHE